MRGIVLLEGLGGDQLPMPMQATVRRRYKHLLGGQLPVQVVELEVPRDRVLTAAMQIAEALRPTRFYAHFLDDQRMYVAFPSCLVLVRREDETSAEIAREIGMRYEIPREQMRFGEMFDNDHPDSPVHEDVVAWTH